jgi:hypothetical protein
MAPIAAVYTYVRFCSGPAAAAHPFSRRVPALMEGRGLLTRVYIDRATLPAARDRHPMEETLSANWTAARDEVTA